MKKRMIIVTALIMGTLGAECVSVQALSFVSSGNVSDA